MLEPNKATEKRFFSLIESEFEKLGGDKSIMTEEEGTQLKNEVTEYLLTTLPVKKIKEALIYIRDNRALMLR